MMELKTDGGSPPVCFDCTHSTQLPGTGEQTGGRPERSPMLARAATAAGVHALFIECHPEPAKSLSDSSTILPLGTIAPLLKPVAAIAAARSQS
jgi:2-dehydro-3-deoxyphosphooctonate aldolase (KDO 8-P synthase)